MTAKDDRKGHSLLGIVLGSPLRAVRCINRTNLRMFRSVVHYSGFRVAVRTARNVLSNSMDDYRRAEGMSTYGDEDSGIPEKMELPFCADPEVSIVIPVYNKVELTLSCIRSIIDNTSEAEYEVLVADDGSTDATVSIGDRVSNLIVVKDGANRGFIRNCNNAAKHVRGKFILFLNNDTVVKKNWLKPMLDLMHSSDSIGIVGSKLIYPTGALQEAGGIIWMDGTSMNYGKGRNPNEPEYNYVREVDYVSGASLLVRRNLFEQLGGFDELYAPAYCEDSDLAFRVREAGFSVMYQPLSEVVHFEGMTHGRDGSSVVNRYQSENIVKFRNRWADRLSADACRPWTDIFHARDRSQSKKAILVVAQHTPSGNPSTRYNHLFSALKILAESGYNVKFAPVDFHYDETDTVRLEQLGIEVLCGVRYRDDWKRILHENRRNIDYICVFGYDVADHFMRALDKNSKARICYIIPRNITLGFEREYDITQDSYPLMSIAKTKRRQPRLIKRADICVVSDRRTEDYVASSCRSPMIARVQSAAYPADRPGFASKGRGMLFVGSMFCGADADAVTWFAEKMIPLLRDRFGGSGAAMPVLHVVGEVPGDWESIAESGNVVFHSAVSAENFASVSSECAMYVNPMRFDSGIVPHVADALAAGMPVVSTSVGLEGLDGLEYPSFDDPELFADEIFRILSDPEYSGLLGGKGRAYADEHLSEEGFRNSIKKLFG